MVKSSWCCRHLFGYGFGRVVEAIVNTVCAELLVRINDTPDALTVSYDETTVAKYLQTYENPSWLLARTDARIHLLCRCLTFCLV
jgi:hypothetical protein